MGLGNTPRHTVPGVGGVAIDPTPATLLLSERPPVTPHVIAQDEKTYHAKAGAGGKATIELPRAQGRQVLKVEKLATYTVPERLGARAIVYRNEEADENFRTGTDAGSMDENDANHPYLVKSGDRLVVVFDGLTEGDDAYCALQWRVEPDLGARET